MHQPFDESLNEYVLLVSREPLPVDLAGRPSRTTHGRVNVEVSVEGRSVIEVGVTAKAWQRMKRDPTLRGERTVMFVAQLDQEGGVVGELGLLAEAEAEESWAASACRYEESQAEDRLEMVVLGDSYRSARQRRYPQDLAREALSMLAEACLSGTRTPDAGAVDAFLASLGAA